MNWESLKYVLAAGRAQTLLGAADLLGTTHTTVGRRIRASEEELGVRLFDRTSNGLFPTLAGQELIDVAERLEAEVLAAESRIVGQDARLHGPLRVSVLDYCFWSFRDAFESFIHRYPSIELTLTATEDQVSLVRREADVVLRLTDSPAENLFGRRLGTMQFAVYASSELVKKIGADAPLEAYPWLGWDERLDNRWFETWLKDNAPGARTVLRIDENAILRREAIRSGVGVFFLACLEGDALEGVQRISAPHFERGLWLLTLSELRHTSRVHAFFGHMVEAISASSEHGLLSKPT